MWAAFLMFISTTIGRLLLIGAVAFIGGCVTGRHSVTVQPIKVDCHCKCGGDCKPDAHPLNPFRGDEDPEPDQISYGAAAPIEDAPNQFAVKSQFMRGL